DVFWRPVLQYWFLYALILVFVAYMLFFRAGVSPLGIAGLGAIFFVAGAVLDFGAISYVLGQTAYLAVFLALGAVGRESVPRVLQELRGLPLLVVSVISASIVLAFVAAGPLHPPIFVVAGTLMMALVTCISMAELVVRSPFRTAATLL